MTVCPEVKWRKFFKNEWLRCQVRWRLGLTMNRITRRSLKILFYFIFVFVFLGLHLRHLEVSRLGVESELLLLAYTTVTATWDLSGVCDLHHSSQQGRFLNHWARPGIEPMSWWILVGFIILEPRELLKIVIKKEFWSSGGCGSLIGVSSRGK